MFRRLVRIKERTRFIGDIEVKVGKAIEILEGISLMDEITPELDEAVTVVVDELRRRKFGDRAIPARERQSGRDAVITRSRLAEQFYDNLDQVWEAPTFAMPSEERN
jgi:hypothetical protein